MAKIFKIILLPFVPLRKAFFRLIVLPGYDRYLRLKSKFSKKATSRLEKFILIFTNRYIIHILIISIALGVATSNILAYESGEDYGRDALIYQIIGMETYDMEEDTVIGTTETKIDIPIEETNQLTRDAFFTEAQQQQEEIIEQQIGTELASTQDGSVLIKPELTSTEAAKITRTSIKNYEVQEGDTIGGIATQFNISVNTLLWANNLSFRSLIKPGQKLVIPPTSGVLHTIKRGDTLKSIASKYRASESKVKDFNNISSNDVLAVGEIIMVPGGQIVYTVPTRTYNTVTTPAYSTPSVPTGGKMYWPSDCRRISQYYRGWRHSGLDIACGFGKPIRAAETGTVSAVKYHRYGYGYHVIIDHGNGRQTVYAHLSRIYVKNGQKVDKAQVIGLEGSTGRSTGAHLHFEVRINGSRLNPLNYIR